MMARDAGVTVLGTGINPGFMMDTLPIVLSAPCVSVKSIKVHRVIDAAKRRIPFQAKVGTGLTPKQLEVKIKKNEVECMCVMFSKWKGFYYHNCRIQF